MEPFSKELTVEAVPLAWMKLTTSPPLRLDNTPTGTRVIIEFPEIELTGDRLRAKKKGQAAADWLTIGPDGTGTLDFRALLETHDGALIYVHGVGRNDADQFLAGGPNYFSFSFETGDDRYRWLNHIQAIAKGRLDPKLQGAIMFSVYELR